jgi:phage tail P2-like protein
MSTAPSLLPPNATPLEKRIAGSGFAAPAQIVPTLWDADTCPAALLPWLAWAESVDDWNAEWSEERQRAVIKASRAVHRLKGTPAAIKQALVARGQPDAEVIERYESAATGDSSQAWAIYKVVLKHPVTRKQAWELQDGIAPVARNCCHFAGFDYLQAALLHNNQCKRDGSYTRGFISIQST